VRGLSCPNELLGQREWRIAMITVRYRGKTYFWNPFWCFFFLPVGESRKKERIIKSGRFFEKLRALAEYP